MMRAAFEHRRDLVVKLLKNVPHISYSIPEAAFYVFFDVSYYLGHRTPEGIHIRTSYDICRMLLEDFDLALVPGDAFGVPSAIRISFAASEADITEGVTRLAKGLAAIR